MSTTIVVPWGSRLLVELDPDFSTAGSMIERPDSVPEEMPESGVVIAVGGGIVDGSYYMNRRVVFQRYSGYRIQSNGKPCCLLDVTEILGCVWEESDAAESVG